MSSPYGRDSGFNSSEGIFIIESLCQRTSLKVQGSERTCLATVFAQEYFLEVVHMGLKFLVKIWLNSKVFMQYFTV